jgi:hypothetical protein
MAKVEWTQLALKGLARCIASDRLESARNAIELKLNFAPAAGLRRLPAFSNRQIFVFTLFAGAMIRLVVEIDDDKTIWHVGLQPDQTTE